MTLRARLKTAAVLLTVNGTILAMGAPVKWGFRLPPGLLPF